MHLVNKCDGYTKGDDVNMCMIDTQNEDVCDRYTKWMKCDWYPNKWSQTELLWMNCTYNIVHDWERNLIGTMHYNAWCLRKAINRRSGALESTSWGEWRWTALLRRGSPLVLFEHFTFNSQYKGSEMLTRVLHVEHFGCCLSFWSYSQLSLFSNGVTD